MHRGSKYALHVALGKVTLRDKEEISVLWDNSDVILVEWTLLVVVWRDERRK